MRNLTVSLKDSVYEESRVIAAERNTTVTGLVRDYLSGLVDEKANREAARREILPLVGTFDCQMGRMPSREERNARR